MKLISFALASALAATCTAPAPPAPAKFDAGQASCASACANLLSLGCHEGFAATCISSCDHAPVLHTDMKVRCLTDAVTKEAARACGTVACP